MRALRLPHPVVLTLAALALLCGGCAGRPFALDYVVLPNHEADPPPTKEELKLERAALDKSEARYPIYADEPKRGSGTGGSGCGVGLIGKQCERGLLSDEPPLSEQQFLGEDWVVTELTLHPARTRASDRRRPRHEARARPSAGTRGSRAPSGPR